MATDRQKVSAVILAGGQSRRMGGEDKGLIALDGRPLTAWVLDRIAPQVDELFISANRHLEQYRHFGYPVLADASPDFLGPLAGLRRIMAAARHPLILCAPCDTPFLPHDLVERLLAVMRQAQADLALPVAGGQRHRAVFLCRATLLSDLESFLDQGGRRVGEWQSRLNHCEVEFADERAFLNLNTPADLAASSKDRPHAD